MCKLSDVLSLAYTTTVSQTKPQQFTCHWCAAMLMLFWKWRHMSLGDLWILTRHCLCHETCYNNNYWLFITTNQNILCFPVADMKEFLGRQTFWQLRAEAVVLYNKMQACLDFLWVTFHVCPTDCVVLVQDRHFKHIVLQLQRSRTLQKILVNFSFPE